MQKEELEQSILTLFQVHQVHLSVRMFAEEPEQPVRAAIGHRRKQTRGSSVRIRKLQHVSGTAAANPSPAFVASDAANLAPTARIETVVQRIRVPRIEQ